MEAAAYLVVHPAAGHLAQRQLHHLECLLVAAEEPVSQEKFADHRLWKLGRLAESAVLVVERRRELSVR